MFNLSRNMFTLPRIAIAAGLLAAGSGIGAATVIATRPPVAMAPSVPVPIGSLAGRGSDEVVTVQGKVADVFGGRFIVRDASGRVLVEAGRRGEGEGLVAIAQTVTVQGNLHDDVLHGLFLVDANGRVVVLDRLGRAHRGFDGEGRHGRG